MGPLPFEVVSVEDAKPVQDSDARALVERNGFLGRESAEKRGPQ
ncbi:hypothetical protein [Cupriavidus numazuensis]|nr:hypothetical protein [Cupriavidus numazuensis]